MAFWNRNKPQVESLGALMHQEDLKSQSKSEKPFDSAKAEQLNLFTEEGERPVAEIGQERINRAVAVGKQAFEKVSGMFRGAWKGAKLDKAASFAATPDVAVKRAVKTSQEKVGTWMGEASELSHSMHGWVSTKLESAGAGADQFLDRVKDAGLAKFADKIGLRDKMNPAIIKSPETKNSILGLESDERSMGGELLVGGTIFDRVRDFYHQAQDLYAHRQTQLTEVAQRREQGLAYIRQKEQNRVTGRKVAEGVEAKRREQSVLDKIKEGKGIIKAESFAQLQEIWRNAEAAGVDLSGVQIEIRPPSSRKEAMAA